MATLKMLEKSFATQYSGTITYQVLVDYTVTETATNYSISARFRLQVKCSKPDRSCSYGDLYQGLVSSFYVGTTTANRKGIDLEDYESKNLPAANTYYDVSASSYVSFSISKSKTTTQTLTFWLTDGNIVMGESYSDGEVYLVSGTYQKSSTPATATLTIPKVTSYPVAYNANGGSGAPAAQTKWYNEALSLSSAVPSRSGYAFWHWNTNASNTGATYSPGASYTANAALSLYAIWNPIVSYNANGGSGAPAAQTKTYGSDLTLSSTEPTRVGHVFKGWNTSPDGSGTPYSPGGTYSANAPATLYAQWAAAVVISDIEVSRVDANGEPDDMGGRIRCSISWSTDSTLGGQEATASCAGVTGSAALSGTGGTAVIILDVGARPDATYAVTATVTATSGATATATGISTAESTGYSPPSVGSVSAVRTDAQGEPDDEGAWALVNFDWRVAAVGSQAAPRSITVEVSENGTVIESHTATSFSGASGTYSHLFGGQPGSFEADKQYLVTATVRDAINEASKSDVLTTAFFTMDVKAGGHGVSFGAPARQDAFNVSMPAFYYEVPDLATLYYPALSKDTRPAPSDVPGRPCRVILGDGTEWLYPED